MSSIVFILGAGASKAAGAPLMWDFLDQAERLWLTDKVKEADRCFEAVFKGRNYLTRVHSKSQLDVRNVESVFAAFEMARILGRFGNYTSEEIDELVSGMKSVIVKTLEESIAFGSQSRTAVPEPYGDFAGLLKKIRKGATPKQTVSVITFNYDLAVDYAFHCEGLSPVYGFEEKGEEAKLRNAIPLLKLHGSLNWAQCSACNEVFAWDLNSCLHTPHTFKLDLESDRAILAVGSRIGEAEHRDGRANSEPVIVPPTWNKSEHYRSLHKVWGRAAQELSEAESIFVIGYSLPESDSFFRFLYALGTINDSILKRFWIFDPDEGVANKFEALLGPGAKQSFSYPKTIDRRKGIERGYKFDEAIPFLSSTLVR